MTGNDWIGLFGVLGLGTLIPVIWAIVDVARRPPWQFSTSRKVLWAVTLGFGWLLLWPLALVSSVVYLVVLRRRFPRATSSGPGVGHARYGSRLGGYQPYRTSSHDPRPFGGPYGGQPYGGVPRGPGGPFAYGNSGYPQDFSPSPPPPLPPAGWYPDPAGSDQQRWWDGRGWSNHLRAVPS